MFDKVVFGMDTISNVVGLVPELRPEISTVFEDEVI